MRSLERREGTDEEAARDWATDKRLRGNLNLLVRYCLRLQGGALSRALRFASLKEAALPRFSGSLVSGLRLLAAVVRLKLPETLRIERERKAILSSGLFDPVWYASNHPEVLLEGADPASHFVAGGWKWSPSPNPLFDLHWYVETYPEAVHDGLNPLLHYIRVGARQGARPGPWFDPEWYVGQLPEPLAPHENPLRHYLRSGAARGLSPNRDFDPAWYCKQCPDAAASGLTPFGHFLVVGRADWRLANPSDFSLPGAPPASSIRNLHSSEKICVLVPVYNAAREVSRCIQSLLAHTPSTVDILIIDDSSTDPAVEAVLAGAGSESNVKVVRNPENLGFTRTVNRGIALAERSDVVMLNSDTEVTPRWLTYLRTAAYDRDDVGTATALSNSASQFSVPLRFHNSVPYWTDLASYARALAQLDQPSTLPIPFGHGFCLYLKRSYIDAVGALDSESFPRGYGEEVDLCLRGARLGWKHVLAMKSFVYHVNAASFGPTKTDRKARARAVIDRLYPEYTSMLRLFSRNPEMDGFRYRVGALWRRIGPPHPRRLFVVSSDFTRDKQRTRALFDAARGTVSPFLLVAQAQRLSLYRLENGAPSEVTSGNLVRAPGPFSPYGEGYEALLGRWLLQYAIESVEIRSLRGHGAGLTRLARQLKLPVTLVLEDDYPFCPTGELRDQEGRKCGGVCTPGSGDCLKEPDSDGRLLKHQYILAWQQAQRAAMAQVDRLVVSSPERRRTLRSLFPEILATEIEPSKAEDEAACAPASPSAAPSRSRGSTRRKLAMRLRVCLLPLCRRGVVDRDFHNRVLAPLTHPVVSERLELSIGAVPEDRERDVEADVVIVSFMPSVGALPALEKIRERCARQGVPLIMDLGHQSLEWAFPAAGDVRSGELGSLDSLLAAMAEVWTAAAPRPDSKLTGLGERLIIVPTCIDERIWRYADSGEPRSHAEKLRLLFLEKGSNDGPFAFMDRVIESLAEQQRRAIELTVVTRRKGLSKRPWMRRIRPPDAAISYPVFASWMLQRGRFDLGVHPPGEDPALAQTSILEHAALGAGTLVSVPGREKPGCDERGLVTFLSPSEGAWKEVLDRHLRVDGLLRRSQGASLHRLLQERSSRVAAEILVERLVAFGR